VEQESRIKSQDIQGKTLREVSPALYDETVKNLQALNISPVLCVINAEEAQRLVESLAGAVICGRCECGQDDCETYMFAPEGRDGGQMHHVRFYSDNEHVVSFDDDYRMYDVERLYAIPRAAADGTELDLDDAFLLDSD
jgi:hypothetical protein